MALDDSDAEFERFLQDDAESSMSTSPVLAKQPHKKPTKSLSSSSAITSATAALLASSKLIGKAGKASKASKTAGKKSRAKGKPRVDLSDSEEPPPDYDAGYEGYTDEADPYAFDLQAAPVHAEMEDFEPVKKKEKKEKKEKIKAEPVKKQTRSAVSIEDRVAAILKRTGSSITPAAVEKNELSLAEPVLTPEHHQHGHNEELKADEMKLNDIQDESASGGRSSASDSLGMESADFEVGAVARRKLELSRLSLSSLNSDKFAVNIGALEDSDRTPSRYQQPRLSLDKSEYEASEWSGKDEYGEDGFELDQTTIGDIPGVERPTATGSVDVEEREVDVVRESETFGYDDDDFEDDNATQLDEQQGETSFPAVADDDADAGYEDEAFESQDVDGTRLSADGELVTDTTIGANERQGVKGAEEEKKLDFAAVLAAKYGDFYAEEEEEEAAPAPLPATTEVLEAEAGVLTMEQLVPEDKEPPMSPPPPPPPDDEYDNDLDGFSLNDTAADTSPLQAPRDTLQDPSSPQNPPSPPPTAQTSPPHPVNPYNEPITPPAAPTEATTSSSSHPQHSNQVNAPVTDQPSSSRRPLLQLTHFGSEGDRFGQIQSRVASLRFLQTATDRPNNLPSPLSSHSSAYKPGYIAAPLLPDFDVLLDDVDDVEGFIRESQMLRARRHSLVGTRQSQAKETELALRLQQAQRQIEMLKQHIQREDGSPELQYELGTTDEVVNVDHSRQVQDRPTYNELQKEFQTQEKLIEAFQRENEKLMRQLKQVQQSASYDVHTENESLRRQLAEAKQRLEGVELAHVEPNDRNRQLRAAVDARLHAEARALSVQDELESERREHREKQNELRVELDRVKKAKKELECRYEGVDLAKVELESKQVQLLQKELELRKNEFEHSLSSLQKKLDWYIDNQRLLDEQDGELRRLKLEKSELKAELDLLRASTRHEGTPVKLKTSGTTHKSPYRRSPSDIRRIQELEARLVEMEAAMRKRHPDSLVNLILASRKADEESKVATLEAEFEDKVRAMEKQMEAAHEAHEKKMKSFRQQQDRLVLQYQRRLREQDVKLAERGRTGGIATRSTRRSGHKEKMDGVEEVERVRRFYTNKVKEVERKWETKYLALKKHQYSGMDQSVDAKKPDREQRPDEGGKFEEVQRALNELESENKELRAQLEQQNSSGGRGNEQNEQSQSRERAEELEKQLQASEDAREQLVKTLVAVQSLSSEPPVPSEPPVEPQDGADDAQVLGKLREQVRQELMDDSNAVVSRLEAELKASTGQLAGLKAANEQLEQLVERLKSDKQGLELQFERADALGREMEAMARRVPRLEHEVLALRRRANVPKTPSMLQYRALELQVETLAHKHGMREAELRVLLEQAMMSSHLERLNRERVHRSAIAAKNAEISSFKEQLGDILGELALLKPAATEGGQEARHRAVVEALDSPLVSAPPSSARYPPTRVKYLR